MATKKRSSSDEQPTQLVSLHDDKSSLSFLSSYINAHKRLSLQETDYCIRRFRYGYDLKAQLIKERDSVYRLLLVTEEATERLIIQEELDDLDYFIENDPQIKRMHYYRNKLISHNLKLIIKVASSYQGKGLTLDDLIQEGSLGFIRGIEKFNPDAGIRLSTYVCWWIRQKITRALSNKTRMIRLPVHITSQVTKVLYAMRSRRITKLEYEYIPQLMKDTGFTEDKIKDVFEYICSFSPANQILVKTNEVVVNGGSGDEETKDSFTHLVDLYIFDEPEPGQMIALEHLRKDLNKVIDKLSYESRWVLLSKFGWLNTTSMTFEEMDKELNLMDSFKKKSSRAILLRAFTDLLVSINADKNLEEETLTL